MEFRMCGGTGPETPADDNVQGLVDHVNTIFNLYIILIYIFLNFVYTVIRAHKIKNW